MRRKKTVYAICFTILGLILLHVFATQFNFSHSWDQVHSPNEDVLLHVRRTNDPGRTSLVTEPEPRHTSGHVRNSVSQSLHQVYNRNEDTLQHFPNSTNDFRRTLLVTSTPELINTSGHVTTDMFDRNTEIPFVKFSYPLDVDMFKLVSDFKRYGHVDYPVINAFKQRYLHNPEIICRQPDSTHPQRGEQLFLLFVVKSKYDNWRAREVIRETWGNSINLSKFNIKIVFILGVPVLNDGFVRIEIRNYNDIILMDFVDTYYNNTLKMSTAFNWAADFCRHARFVVLIDDDFYVSVQPLVLHLKQLPSIKRTHLYMGRTFHNKPHRHRTSKWFVSVAEYPWDWYPPFISAGTVVMTMDFVTDVRIAMRYTKRYRLDDIYLAIIAYKLGVAPVGHPGIYGHKVLAGAKDFSQVFTSHGFTPDEMKATWLAVRRNSLNA